MTSKSALAGVLSMLLSQQTVAQMPTPISTAEVSAQTGDHVTLPLDTPVELMAMTEVTTASAKSGTKFKARVNKPVVQGGRTVVPVGSWGYGEVVTATSASGLGKSGKMTARLTHIALGDAKIPLDGQISAKGTGSGSAGVAVLMVGLTGLFHRGNNAKIKAGEIIHAFVSEEVTLDMAATPIRQIAPTSASILK